MSSSQSPTFSVPSLRPDGPAVADSEPLRAAQAARQLGIPTKELLRLVYERRIRYVMLNGIAHIPSAAIEEYQAQAS